MRSKTIIGLCLIIFLSLLPLINLLTPGLPMTHDGLDHVVRIANFYQSLTEGVIIPRWAGNLNWGYGHPILMFLYPLPSYSASLFHFFGFSFVDSTKLVFAISYTSSGIFMYLWLKSFLSEKAAIVGSVLFLFAPYRFIDLYVRGAIGEHTAFVFMPLVLLALYKLNSLSNKNSLRNYYFLSLFVGISFAGLILSHNAISLLFISFLLFYIFYLYYERKSNQKIILSLFSLLLGFLFSFFFWFPAFMEGKYTLRDIVTAGEYATRFVNPTFLIYGPWNFGGTGLFSVQIGLVHISLFVVSVLFFLKLFKKKYKQQILFLGTTVLLLTSIFLMLEQSKFAWETVTTLQKLQFPWRFLSIVVFCSSLIGALFISQLKTKFLNVIVLAIIVLSIILTVSYWHAKKYSIVPQSLITSVYNGTTDTGESAPIWSVRFMEKRPKDNIEVIEGNAQIIKLGRKSNYHEYVLDVKEKSRIRENTLYFPGWKVYDNGRLVESVEFQDPKNRGVITFYLEPGLHNVILRFEETKLRSFANYTSTFSLLIVLAIPLLFLVNSTLVKKLKW